MELIAAIKTKRLSPEQIFMLSVLSVNGGNYLYNLVLGRLLGPEQFADAAVLITFLLVLSFVAMTFQLLTAKFSVVFENQVFQNFLSRVYRNATLVGVGFGILIIASSYKLQAIFNTSSSSMFLVFGLGVPLYFIMSVNRGVYQGKKAFKSLSITYQAEMLSRLLITIALILLFDIQSSLIISIGILISFGFGLVPFQKKQFSINRTPKLDTAQAKAVRKFFIITAFYELSQIVINNSDILIVKHYFDSYDAGLYASLALIGRVVYFVAWMFVMLLLPTVVALKKEGKSTAPVLIKYVGYISMISALIILGCLLFPETIISLLFGDSYISMAPLLWKYALATSLFAVANIFAYYYLSIDNYIPVIITAVFGLLQMLLVIYFHQSLEQVVIVQIIAMVLLLVIQSIFFALNHFKMNTQKLNL